MRVQEVGGWSSGCFESGFWAEADRAVLHSYIILCACVLRVSCACMICTLSGGGRRRNKCYVGNVRDAPGVWGKCQMYRVRF